jgi:hypothetical protein
MPRPHRPLLYNYLTNINGKKKAYKSSIISLRNLLHSPITSLSVHSPQHPVLEHPQLKFIPWVTDQISHKDKITGEITALGST